MTPDPSLFINKIRRLSLMLIISGVLNIGVLSLLLYWILSERLPTPYCELKPASSEQQQTPLADQRGCVEMLSQLSQLSYSQLVNRLSHTQLIENGYAERNLALACLMAFHHFDLHRALPKNAQPQEHRLLEWKPKGQESSTMLVVYPDLSQSQFDAIIHFAKTERWPLTAEGLFAQLQHQKASQTVDDHLVETFVLTPEFWTVELLFNRSGQRVDRQEILTILLDGDWMLLKQFVDQQRQIHDSSDARQQKFLLDYIKAGSPSAVVVLLKREWEFAVKKLDDQQVVSILQQMPKELPEGSTFAKEMLASPRGADVWRQASLWLYAEAGELMPQNWTHHAALLRFVPEKASRELVSKPPQTATASITSPLTLSNAKKIKAGPLQPLPPSTALKPQPVLKPAPIIAKVDSPPKTAPKVSTKKKEVVTTVPAPVPVPLPVKPLVYVVQDGDSLWKIAKRFGVKVDEIKKLNQLKSDVLQTGMILKIPKLAVKS